VGRNERAEVTKQHQGAKAGTPPVHVTKNRHSVSDRTDKVEKQPAVIVAAMQATSVIPIVFAAAGDPVGTGLIASLARPGGNVTGLSMQQTDLAAKRLELLREVVPGLRRLAILANVGRPAVVLDMREVETAARTLGLEVITAEIQRGEDIVTAFETLKGRADALYVCIDPLVHSHRIRINL